MENIVRKTIVVVCNPSFPEGPEDDEVYTFHRALLHMGFLYCHLKEAIQYEDGRDIIRMWRFWLIHLLGGNRSNYANEAANLIANIEADWDRHVAHIHTHFRTVNIKGKPGGEKPIDQLVEHYNL